MVVSFKTKHHGKITMVCKHTKTGRTAGELIWYPSKFNPKLKRKLRELYKRAENIDDYVERLDKEFKSLT